MSSDAELRILLCGIFALLAGIIGHVVTSRREKSRQISEQIKELEDRVWEMAGFADMYWKADRGKKEADELSVRIRVLSKRIGGDLGKLCARKPSFGCCWRKLADFRKEATGGEFDQKTKRPDRDRGELVLALAGRLVGCLQGVNAGRG